MKSFLEYLLESKSAIVNALEKSFDHGMLVDPSQNFTPTQDVMDKVFDILNRCLFNNQLEKIPVQCLTSQEIQQIFTQHHNPANPEDYYALYYPRPNWKIVNAAKTHQAPKLMLNHYLIMNTSNEKMSFAFAISALCHEMIHYYDCSKGDLLYQQIKTKFNCNEHKTDMFLRKQEYANKSGLSIISCGDGKTLKELSEEAVHKILQMDETVNEIEKNSVPIEKHAIVTFDKDGNPDGIVF